MDFGDGDLIDKMIMNIVFIITKKNSKDWFNVMVYRNNFLITVQVGQASGNLHQM